MTFKDVIKELNSFGTEQTRKIYNNHGADIEQFGVSIAQIKKIAKKLKDNHALGVELLHSKNVDAIYLSQYVVDPNKLTREDLECVIDATGYYMILDNVVAPLIARNKNLVDELLYSYIESENSRKKQIGYSAYSMILGSFEDGDLDYNHVRKTIDYVKHNIHNQENRVRYSMNNFLIAAGAANAEITDLSKEVAMHIGKVQVYMGNTSCKVPDAYSYIEKIESKGYIGKKRKLK